LAAAVRQGVEYLYQFAVLVLDDVTAVNHDLIAGGVAWMVLIGFVPGSG
jgi:hypothetical protein